jgi:Protein of unknown function (DUF3800)
MIVFIDEAGDPGFKLGRGSTDVFVVALVAFRDVAASNATQAAIEALARRLKIRDEFRFNKTRNQVRDIFEAVRHCNFRVRSIVVRKERIYSQHLRAEKEDFYRFFVRSMLSHDSGLLRDARVIIDGSGDRTFKRELQTYLKRQLREGAVRDLRFSNSANDRLLQLADMCAGAIARSYRAGDRDNAWRWRWMLLPRLENVWEFK